MACLDDNTLLAYVERALPAAELRSVSEHLNHCEDCLIIACAVARSEGATMEGASPATRGRLPRELVGRYALIEMIGRGGMGSVFLAHDPQLDRNVALKVVRAERFEEPEIRARLSREARAMAKIVHPHVVTVFDAGELDDGVFIAMELVEGATLGRWIAKAPRSWRDLVRVFVAIGRGLAAAHAAGIVHRDFKPDNVLVDRTGRAAVTDFGLAVAEAAPMAAAGELAAIPVAEAMHTRTGALVGTPLYMSPEQFAGKPLDARSDQFSFAITLYEALYAQKPFVGATVGELLDAVTSGQLRARPARTPVPARVHRVIARALGTVPETRFPSMAAMLDALEASMHPRWPRAAAVGAVVVLGAIGALVVARGGDAQVPRPGMAPPAISAPIAMGPDAPSLVVVVAPFANTTGDPRLDDTLDLALEDELFRSTRLDPIAGEALARREAGAGSGAAALDAIVARALAAHQHAIVVRGAVAPDPAGGFAVTIDARGTRGVPVQLTARDTARTPDGAIDAAARLGDVLRVAIGDPTTGVTEPGPSRSLVALHEWAAAQRFATAGDLSGQIHALLRAIAADARFVDAHAQLGLIAYNASSYKDASHELEAAVHDSDRMPERHRLGLLGDYDDTVGRYEEAIASYEQSLARWPGETQVEIKLGATALDAGSWPLALDLARQAAKAHGELPVVRANLVLADVANGHLDDAIRDGDDMLAAIAQPTPNGLIALAIAHVLHGEPEAARALFDRVEPMAAQRADGGRADLALYEGRLDDAQAILTKWIDAATQKGKPRLAASQQLMLAQLLLRRGDRAGAAKAAKAAESPSSPRFEYMVASSAIAAGVIDGAADRARDWLERDSADFRLVGELLTGDLALAAGKPRDAIAAYERAGRLGHWWIQRARLGRAELAAHAWADADRDLAWCHDHRSEGAVFMTPSLALLPEVDDLLAQARAKH